MTTARVVVVRRTWPQRMLIAGNLALIGLLLSASTALGYFYWRFGQLPKISFADGVLPEAEGPAFNVLVVGSDSRANLSGADRATKGDTSVVSGQRADTMIVVRVDPDRRRASMLSIPRDLWVPIAGTNHRQRVNSAFIEGPERLIATVSQYFDIPIHHYAEVDFNGFRGVVKAIGGVDVYFPGPARDRLSELDVPAGGCIELNGEQALAYVRSRHYEYVESGRWRSDPTGDIGRISRQQDFIRRLLQRVSTGLPLNPIRLNQLVDAGIGNIRIDDQLDFDQLVRLARRFRSLNPGSIEMLTLPVRDATLGGAAVLLLEEEDAEPVLKRFRDEVPGGPAVPSTTSVRVLNGTGVGGQATSTSRALQVVGFNVLGTADADRYGVELTQVRFATGQQAKAELVRAHLIAGALLVEDPALTAVDVAVVTGADYRGVSEQSLDHGQAQLYILDTAAGAVPTPTTTPPTTRPASATTVAPAPSGGEGGRASSAAGADPRESC